MPRTIADDIAALLERDPGFRCAYCASSLVIGLERTSTGHLEWEEDGWELCLLPDGTPVWQPMDGARMCHRDHIVAKARGGSNSLDNLVLACAPCNMSKKADSLLMFLARRAA